MIRLYIALFYHIEWIFTNNTDIVPSPCSPIMALINQSKPSESTVNVGMNKAAPNTRQCCAKPLQIDHLVFVTYFFDRTITRETDSVQLVQHIVPNSAKPACLTMQNKNRYSITGVILGMG